MRGTALLVDPPHLASNVGTSACSVWIVDRGCPLGVARLQSVCGPAAVAEGLRRPGQWLVGIRTRSFAGVSTVADEAQLLAANRSLLELPVLRGTHVQLFLQHVDPNLRRRVIEDAQLHALRMMPAGGRA